MEIKSGKNKLSSIAILYHIMAGMGTVFTYIDSPANPELPDPVKACKDFKKDNRMIHPMAKIGLKSNGTDGEAMLADNRYALHVCGILVCMNTMGTRCLGEPEATLYIHGKYRQGVCNRF